ncbi:hypothetical protein V7968_29110 [Nocardia vulneris]|uniref:hypothetical protein n=1 Tax=Nocardia vulneris TaxID=1141657 RepID=UPI0030CCEE65
MEAAVAAANRGGPTVHVPVEVDTASAIAEAQSALPTADLNAHTRVDLDVNADPAQLAALRALGDLSDRNVQVRVGLNTSTAEQARLKGIAPALRSISRLSDRHITVRIVLQADEVRLMRIASVLGDIRVRNVRMDVDTDRGVLDRLNSMGSLLGGPGKHVGITAAVGADLSAARGSAGAAVGAVGGPAVGLRRSGLRPKEAAAQAKAVQAAQDGARSALSGVTSAQKVARAASKDLADANQDLEQAYCDARGKPRTSNSRCAVRRSIRRKCSDPLPATAGPICDRAPDTSGNSRIRRRYVSLTAPKSFARTRFTEIADSGISSLEFARSAPLASRVSAGR